MRRLACLALTLLVPFVVRGQPPATKPPPANARAPRKPAIVLKTRAPAKVTVRNLKPSGDPAFARVPKPGQIAVLGRTADGVKQQDQALLTAPRVEVYVSFLTMVMEQRQDDRRIARWTEAGDLVAIPEGTRARVVRWLVIEGSPKEVYSPLEVRVLDGPKRGRLLWVPYALVARATAVEAARTIDPVGPSHGTGHSEQYEAELRATAERRRERAARAAERHESEQLDSVIGGAGLAVGICGAPTRDGTPCQRRVSGGGYCFQHR